MSGTTLTVTSKMGPNGGTGTTYSVDASNATATKSGAASRSRRSRLGDTVVITVTVSGTNMTATKISDGVIPGARTTPGKGSGIVGTVATVNGNSLTDTSKFGQRDATSTTYTVDATNATVIKNGRSPTVSAIAVGDTVMVTGTVSGTSVTATKINDGAGIMGLAMEKLRNNPPSREWPAGRRRKRRDNQRQHARR